MEKPSFLKKSSCLSWMLPFTALLSKSGSPYVIPALSGRGNLTVPLRIYEYEEIASSLRSSQ
jgi:hypothetical protein